MSLTCLSSTISLLTLVIPGVLPTAAALRLRFSELISDDLPTFGKPTIPTVMAVLRLRFRA